MDVIKSVVAQQMLQQCGVKISTDLIVQLPDDGCPGHMGLPRWDVFAARCGEFVCVAYVYADGRIVAELR